jgi:hypothetical protein
MKILFRVKDPIGNAVVLDKICLEKHILVNHPIIRRYKDRIRETIQGDHTGAGCDLSE